MAALQLWGRRETIDAVLVAIGAGGVPVGQHRLRRPRHPGAAQRSRAETGAIDDVVVARWSATSAAIMPHAGPAVVAELMDALRAAGAVPLEGEWEGPALRGVYPEARSLLEARQLHALATASSRSAPGVLLGQVEHWCRVLGVAADDPSVDAAVDAWLSRGGPEAARPRRWSVALGRLTRAIDAAPIVAAVGPPGVGKSTLLNALAGRGVSVTGPTPGTTRDHVGVTLDLAGLTVRWLDLPGIGLEGGGEVDRRSVELGLRAALAAELVVMIGDAQHGFAQVPAVLASTPRLWVASRCDLGRARPPAGGGEPSAAVAIETDARGGVIRARGVEALVGAVRASLVPPEAELAGAAGPWVWWESWASELGGGGGAAGDAAPARA